MATPKAVFRHDGTFTGVICAAAAAFPNRQPGDAVPLFESERDRQLKQTGQAQAELFDQALALRDPSACELPASSVTVIASDPELARRFSTRLKERAGSQALQLLYAAWHSDFPALDQAAACFLAACLDSGASALGNLADPHIGRIAKAAQRANREKHLFMGLVRFRLLADGTYYAPINPDCDILPLLAVHFHRRFYNQDWVIHDVHRGKALFHNKGGATDGVTIEAFAGVELSALQNGAPLPDAVLAPAEKAVQAAFRLYYNDISIAERKNSATQRNFMPKKYWLHLVETPGSS